MRCEAGRRAALRCAVSPGGRGSMKPKLAPRQFGKSRAHGLNSFKTQTICRRVLRPDDVAWILVRPESTTKPFLTSSERRVRHVLSPNLVNR